MDKSYLKRTTLTEIKQTSKTLIKNIQDKLQLKYNNAFEYDNPMLSYSNALKHMQQRNQ